MTAPWWPNGLFNLIIGTKGNKGFIDFVVSNMSSVQVEKAVSVALRDRENPPLPAQRMLGGALRSQLVPDSFVGLFFPKWRKVCFPFPFL